MLSQREKGCCRPCLPDGTRRDSNDSIINNVQTDEHRDSPPSRGRSHKDRERQRAYLTRCPSRASSQPCPARRDSGERLIASAYISYTYERRERALPRRGPRAVASVAGRRTDFREIEPQLSPQVYESEVTYRGKANKKRVSIQRKLDWSWRGSAKRARAAPHPKSLEYIGLENTRRHLSAQ
jgi:hypothetical protein